MRFQYIRCILFIAVAAAAPTVACGSENQADFADLREQALALGRLTDPPAVHEASGVVADGAIKSIFYEALPWKGRPTRVFAWLGVPEHGEGKVPGIVLVHGGGGTAFKEWVAKWNEHGFAAISIAVEGQTDTVKPDGGRGNRWQRRADGEFRVHGVAGKCWTVEVGDTCPMAGHLSRHQLPWTPIVSGPNSREVPCRMFLDEGAYDVVGAS